MEAVLKRLQTLTADQLRNELTGAGLRCGPITATTRSLFEKKLARTLLGEAAVHSGSSLPAEELQQPISEQNREEVTGEAETPEPQTESPCVYYGVCPEPDDPAAEEGSLHVYGDKMKALKAVMKLKGARFKAFARKEDAENFAKGFCVSQLKPSPEKTSAECSVSSDAVNLEKANEFKSPRTQDLTANLRKTVESGDEEAFRELVWGNPRYLIGSGDNPTIVQEGCRYNILHVAAKENQAGIARLLLETLEEPEFMRLMYPNDNELMLQQRIRYIVDLYLNTPDKASNETPLHFACKFGCPEVVDVLCSHPSIDKHCRNKYDQKPSAVICERKNKSKEVKQRIMEYLEDRFYVPLLRAADNTLHPVICAPWCLASPESCDQLNRPDRMMESPKNPIMTVKAFAGPLNSSKAEEFHRLWKTPRREQAEYFHQILKTDSEHGAERVGRELAREMGLPWAEHWAFLGCFIDLCSSDGLKMLEEHLSFTEDRSSAGRSDGWSGAFRDPDEAFPVRDLLQEFEKVLLERSADSGCAADEDGSSCGSDEYFTADSSSSSFKSTHSTTDLSLRAHVFIAGSPSKLDSDVLVALSDVEIEPLSYPSIIRWKNQILSYSPSQRQSWPSPSQMNRDVVFRLNWLTVSPKFRSPGHFNPQRFTFSPPSKPYSRL
ncbi:ankyrin repeat and LEM domain-containing protein 2 isoform X2 [Sinocyclocheilus anshuiensis]|uniref:ankyrin repeat and LEM domain-containing protein 2 isoform X2 n=1 Tax=Sinocyclocheilus anshuiensis TaxID=1608454 RepID=UPI0007B9470C|nr:PREDICTED: ankyrin repeat and LEM domain-containing protein 2-like isoform X2 [Sinocyclocheilus anshuiensis]